MELQSQRQSNSRHNTMLSVAVTVAFIDTVDTLDIVVPFDATVPLLTDQEYESLPLLSYSDLHLFV